MKRVWILAVIMAVVFALAACGNGDPVQTGGGDPVITDNNNQPDDTTPDYTGGAEDYNYEPINGYVPENGEPENGEPDNGEPDNGEPDNGEPDNGEPDNGEPDNGEPDNGEPEPVPTPEPEEAPDVTPEPEPTPEEVTPEPEPTPEPQPEPTAPPAATGGTVVYSLATDEGFQGTEVGASGRGSEILAPTWFLQDAGSPTVTVIATAGGHNGFRVSNRGTSWGYAVDFMRGTTSETPWEMTMAQNTYRITASGVAPAGTHMIIQAHDNPWNHVFHTYAEANNTWSFSVDINNAILMELTHPTDPPGREISQFNRGFRITTYDPANPDYEVHEFVVTRVN